MWIVAIGLASQTIVRPLAYVNPQATTVPGNVFTNQPGPIVQNAAATGTFNPQVVWTVITSAWF